MKRFGGWLALLAVATAGCGGASYEKRLSDTLSLRKVKAELDKSLNPDLDGKYRDEAIFLRTPRPLPTQPSAFALGGVTDANFDIHHSFVTGGQANNPQLSLHVLARHKKPKAPTKGADPAPAPERGDFGQEVLAILNATVPEGVKGPTPVLKGLNEFKRYVGESQASTVEAYVLNKRFGDDNAYDVAVIWIYPRTSKEYARPIDLSIQSMAVGPEAARAIETGGVNDARAGAAQ